MIGSKVLWKSCYVTVPSLQLSFSNLKVESYEINKKNDIDFTWSRFLLWISQFNFLMCKAAFVLKGWSKFAICLYIIQNSLLPWNACKDGIYVGFHVCTSWIASFGPSHLRNSGCLRPYWRWSYFQNLVSFGKGNLLIWESCKAGVDTD